MIKPCAGCKEVSGETNSTDEKGKPFFICDKCHAESESVNCCEICNLPINEDHDNYETTDVYLAGNFEDSVYVHTDCRYKKEQKLQIWVNERMEIYLYNLLNTKNHLYNRLEGLIVFGVLDQLRRDVELDHPTLLPELYKKIMDLLPEARHYFEIHTPKDFNPFGKIDVFSKQQPKPSVNQE